MGNLLFGVLVIVVVVIVSSPGVAWAGGSHVWCVVVKHSPAPDAEAIRAPPQVLCDDAQLSPRLKLFLLLLLLIFGKHIFRPKPEWSGNASTPFPKLPYGTKVVPRSGWRRRRSQRWAHVFVPCPPTAVVVAAPRVSECGS